MKTKILLLVAFLLFAISTSLFLSSCQEEKPGELKKDVLFSLGYGKMEDQINLYEENPGDHKKKNRILMKNGFFYISNGLSGKVMEFNSYGDILNLYYNEDLNPEPVLLSRRTSTEESVTRNLYPYPFIDVGEIGVGSEKKLFVDDQIAENRREFDDELGVALDRILLQFDREGNFIDYLGQEGSGGTPFPFIEKIRVTQRDELVVFSRHLDGWRVFWFSADEKPIYIIDILSEQLPVPDELNVPDLVTFLETIECDPVTRRLYLKIDYNAETFIEETGNSRGFGGSFVWSLDVTDGSYLDPIRLPENIKETITPAIYDEQALGLSYEFVGVAEGGYLYFLSLQGRNSYRFMIIKSDGLVVESGIINLGNERLLMKDLHVSHDGILNAILGWEDKLEVAWWRTDQFITQEEK